MEWFAEARQRQEEVDAQTTKQCAEKVVETVWASEAAVRGRGGRKDKGKATERAHRGGGGRKADGGREITTRSMRVRARAESNIQSILSSKKKK